MTEASNVIAQFEKNSKQEVRVTIDDFHGHKIINIRVYYRLRTVSGYPASRDLRWELIGIEILPMQF
jgi:hypothetical protein